MYIIPFYNNKGGAGKTTSLITVSGILADYFNKRVLVIDTDSQCNSSYFLLKNCEEYNEMVESYEAGEIDELKDLKYAIEHQSVTGCIFHCDYQKKSRVTGRRTKQTYTIDVLPGNTYVDTLDLRAELYRDLLKEYEADYDFVLLDVHPSKEGMTMAVYTSADYIMIPSEAKEAHIEGMNNTIAMLNALKEQGEHCSDTEILGVFITRFIKQASLQTHLYENFISQIGDDIVFNTTTRNSTILDEANFFGEPITSYKPKSDVCRDYIALVKEMLERIEEKEAEKRGRY